MLNRSELWSEIKRQSPSLAALLTIVRKEFGGCELAMVELNGVRYR